jgi:hypothetical protein
MFKFTFRTVGFGDGDLHDLPSRVITYAEKMDEAYNKAARIVSTPCVLGNCVPEKCHIGSDVKIFVESVEELMEE